MIKNIVFAAFVFTASVHAMEKENRWSITAYGTQINLNKGDMLDYYADGEKKVDYIVVGRRAQEGKFISMIVDGLIGECSTDFQVYFETKNKSSNYRALSHHCLKDGTTIPGTLYFPLREGYNVCLTVIEPYVWGAQYYCYNSVRKKDNGKVKFAYYQGDEALEEALKDIRVCYKTVLAKGITAGKRSIALPALGAQKCPFGSFPKEKAAPVAVEAILEFIKNNPKMYDRIELFVEEDFEVDLYKELLMQWRGKENVLLFYFAQKNSEHLISLLLPELIGYIANLI